MHPLLRTLQAHEAQIVLLIVSTFSVGFFLRFLIALIRDELQVSRRRRKFLDVLLTSEEHGTPEITDYEAKVAIAVPQCAAINTSTASVSDSKHHGTKFRWLILPLLFVGVCCPEFLERPKHFDVYHARMNSFGDHTCKTYFG